MFNLSLSPSIFVLLLPFYPYPQPLFFPVFLPSLALLPPVLPTAFFQFLVTIHGEERSQPGKLTVLYFFYFLGFILSRKNKVLASDFPHTVVFAREVR